MIVSGAIIVLTKRKRDKAKDAFYGKSFFDTISLFCSAHIHIISFFLWPFCNACCIIISVVEEEDDDDDNYDYIGKPEVKTVETIKNPYYGSTSKLDDIESTTENMKDNDRQNVKVTENPYYGKIW